MLGSRIVRALNRASHYFALFWRETRTHPVMMTVVIGIWLMAITVVMIQALS